MVITFPKGLVQHMTPALNRLQEIVDGIGRDFYDNNIIYTLDRLGPRRYRLLLKVEDSHGAGTHYSPEGWYRKGRRTPWACWHVHRDVLMEVFATWPEASVRTKIATYRHREGFEQSFQETYYHQRGPRIAPSDYGDLCQCEGNRRAVHTRAPAPEPTAVLLERTSTKKLMGEFDEEYGGFIKGVYHDTVNEPKGGRHEDHQGPQAPDRCPVGPGVEDIPF